jgi:hypothetical protein
VSTARSKFTDFGYGRTFQAWFLDHSNPPDGHYSLNPTIKKVWSGYEQNVCLIADKETIDSVLADTSDDLDHTASIKVLARRFDEEDMRKWVSLWSEVLGVSHGTTLLQCILLT